MKKELWKQVSAVFQTALKFQADERMAYLNEACGNDEELRQRVVSLIEAHEMADDSGFIDVPAIQRAWSVLADEGAKTGETIGQYKIVKRLGAGGMGEVYLAEDTSLKRPAAIKILPAETAQDRDRTRRFVQEARAASALNHPNILTVYQVGDFRSSRFIATEYIKGETLRDRLDRGPLELHEVLDIAIQVAAALDAAHTAGIIHRDVKPENLMVRDDGLVKVLDFGLAKLSGPNVETDDLQRAGTESETRDLLQTRAGTIMGTAAYMSPEQARGLSVDSRTDIWSLGVVIYEMVAGLRPFVGDTASDTIAAILKAEPDKPAEIPPDLVEIIDRTLQKDVKDRYQELNDLLADLRDLKRELEFTAKLERSGRAAAVTADRLTAPTQIQSRTTVSTIDHFTGLLKRRKFAAGGGALAITLAFGVIYYLAGSVLNAKQTSMGHIGSVAVLPFINGSGDPEIEYLSDGMTDSLINSLSQLPELTVKARSSVFQYKGKEVSPQTIGNELSVQTALLGRVTEMSDVLTLSLELVDTKSGDRIWGEIYTRKRADLVSLQSQMARDVASKLGARLSGAEGRRATKEDTADPEAHTLYLQGLYHLNKRTAEDIRKSIVLFGEATEKDPTYAKAYAALASAYTTLQPYSAGLSREEIKGLASKAHESANRAKEIDDSLPEVHAILGSMQDDDWNFAAAEDEYKRAIELNQNDAAIRLSYSLNLSWKGRYQEALDEINKAHELDPFSRSIAFNVGARLAEARRFDEAIAQYRRVLEMEPDHPLTHLVLSQALEAEGRYTEAIPELRSADVLLEKTSVEVADRKAAALKQALRSGGTEGYWKMRLNLSREEYDKGFGLAYRIAVAYARLGQSDRALEQLEKSFANHELFLPWLLTEPAFDSLGDDPRFKDLARRMGLA